jgi:hypothetical protein
MSTFNGAVYCDIAGPDKRNAKDPLLPTPGNELNSTVTFREQLFTQSSSLVNVADCTGPSTATSPRGSTTTDTDVLLGHGAKGRIPIVTVSTTSRGAVAFAATPRGDGVTVTDDGGQGEHLQSDDGF